MTKSRGGVVVLRPSQTPHDVTSLRAVPLIRHAGESLAGASLRALREVGIEEVEPWAVDLSRVQAVFGADLPGTTDLRSLRAADREVAGLVAAVPSATIGFRPLVRGDLEDLVRWVAQPHVAPWWSGGPKDLDSAKRYYGARIDGQEVTRCFVVEVAGRSVGLVQDYLVADHPDYAVLTGEPDAIGVDYLVGDPSWIGNGMVTRLMWTYLRRVVRPQYPDGPTVFAAPDHRNAVSLRVLDKVGFKRGLGFSEPQADGSTRTLVGCTLKVKRILGRPPKVTADA